MELKNRVSVETVASQRPSEANPEKKKPTWQKIVAQYQTPDIRISVIQIFTSIVPFFFCWYLAYRSLEVHYLLTLFFCALSALFVFRSFILLHDCGHGSFSKNQKFNDIIGIITGVMSFTPYFAWRHSHAIHHATSGDLDRRGTGDVWTLTYEEFQKLPRGQRLFYRLYRNPFVIFGIGPTIDFLILQRIGSIVNVSEKPREKWSVVYTNLALLALAIIMSALIGWQNFILIQLPIIAMASSAGVWMFYVQHQFEDVYWERHENWNYADAALHGSSFYKLPRILQWCTGNIGFHHIHHLSPKIPNYRLEECHYENQMFTDIEPLTIRESLKSLRIRLFDEDRGKMIGYHREDNEEATTVQVPSVTPPVATSGAD